MTDRATFSLHSSDHGTKVPY